MRFGSICSGIEAASVAWHPLGWSTAWLAEVDRAASDVLAYRFPDVVNHGDMTALPDMVLRRKIAAPDALVGGTPCQAFSVAGRREGLADARGQLTLSYVDLADAIDRVRADDGDEPCIVVWENVPGVLSSKDNAFGCFLAGLAGEDVPLEPPGKKWGNAGVVVGPKRTIAWRTLDAQYVGLAQRRRRVFVVASAREGFDPASILFEFEGVRRDSPPRREKGQGSAGTLAARTTGGGFPGTDEACSGYVQPVIGDDVRVKWPAEIASTLNAPFGSKLRLEDQHVNSGCPLFVPHPIVVHGTQDPIIQIDQAHTLGRNTGQENAICYAVQPRIGRNGRGDMGDCVNALTAQAGETGKGDAAQCVAYAIQERAVCENPLAGPDGMGVRSDDCAYTLEARSVPQAVCVTGDITHTLKAEGFDASEDGTGRGQPIVQVAMAVRRLMPVECERLQGFPDGWTAVPTGNKCKPAADGPRYKQLGNSMAVNVMHWIGKRIDAALKVERTGHNGGPAWTIEDMFG